MDNWVHQIAKNRSYHLEMFAAAYLKQTGIDPRDAVLIQSTKMTDKGMVATWHFEEREGLKDV